MIYDNMINNLWLIQSQFRSIFSRYQIGLETSMGGNDFIFDCVHLLFYKCHNINPNCGGSYIDSPDWIKTEKHNKSHQ